VATPVAHPQGALSLFTAGEGGPGHTHAAAVGLHARVRILANGEPSTMAHRLQLQLSVAFRAVNPNRGCAAGLLPA
jgi:hypothetical protein